jgi:hypothetical protein
MSAQVSARSALLSIPPTPAFGTVLASNEDPLFQVREVTETSKLQRDVNVLEFKLEANVPTSDGQQVRIILDRDFFPIELKVRLHASEHVCLSCLKLTSTCLQLLFAPMSYTKIEHRDTPLRYAFHLPYKASENLCAHSSSFEWPNK